MNKRLTRDPHGRFTPLLLQKPFKTAIFAADGDVERLCEILQKQPLAPVIPEVFIVIERFQKRQKRAVMRIFRISKPDLQDRLTNRNGDDSAAILFWQRHRVLVQLFRRLAAARFDVRDGTARVNLDRPCKADDLAVRRAMHRNVFVRFACSVFAAFQ